MLKGQKPHGQRQLNFIYTVCRTSQVLVDDVCYLCHWLVSLSHIWEPLHATGIANVLSASTVECHTEKLLLKCVLIPSAHWRVAGNIWVSGIGRVAVCCLFGTTPFPKDYWLINRIACNKLKNNPSGIERSNFSCRSEIMSLQGTLCCFQYIKNNFLISTLANVWIQQEHMSLIYLLWCFTKLLPICFCFVFDDKYSVTHFQSQVWLAHLTEFNIRNLLVILFQCPAVLCKGYH